MSNRFSIECTLAAVLAVMPMAHAFAGESECSPACRQTAAPTDSTVPHDRTGACGVPTRWDKSVATVESINNQLKPVKEIVGYVRSPQGLAVKLVNDHVVKIPAWVGFALDPLGSLKHRALDEARDRAKTALKRAGPGLAGACGGVEDFAVIPGTTTLAAVTEI